jgi:hypothetical protein
MAIDFDQTTDLTFAQLLGIEDTTHVHLHIKADFPIAFVAPQNYDLFEVNLKSVEGDKVAVITAHNAGQNSFTLHLSEVNFKGTDKIRLELGLIFTPEPAYLKEIKKQNGLKTRVYDYAKERVHKEAYTKLVQERIQLASNVAPRPEWEMRDEERSIIYRKLIADLMKPRTAFPRTGKTNEENEIYHITAEIIRTIFDVDKLLYFVAPDWWKPKPNYAANLGAGELSAKDDTTASYRFSLNQKDDVISWGGIDAARKNNYLITEDSAPARYGSSLGWILQLDGDNFRNAFLNSPWVKAVIPIRSGKESAALNWLQLAHVEGTAGLDSVYVAPPAEVEAMISTIKDAIKAGDGDFQSTNSKLRNYVDPARLKVGKFTIHYALRTLAYQIKRNNEDLNKPIEANPAARGDPVNDKAGSLVTEVVFEHGFDPLAGGIKYDAGAFVVYDQWTEILPTDQIVAMNVEYDPRTLRLKE